MATLRRSMIVPVEFNIEHYEGSLKNPLIGTATAFGQIIASVNEMYGITSKTVMLKELQNQVQKSY